jgi:thioredoxin reductase (NADPH)
MLGRRQKEARLTSSGVRNIVIIGSGPAGFTAAIYAARANLKPLLFEGVSWGGQLMITTDVENYPGFPDGVQGPELMEIWRKQALRFGTEIVSTDVTAVDFSDRPFKVWAGDELTLARAVIVATGATARTLGIPGEADYTGRGLSYCATCDGFFFRGKEIVVVGGGDSALEEALFLTRFGSKVTVVHRRDQLRASKIMQDRAFANEKIEFMWSSIPVEVRGEDGQLTGVVLRDVSTGKDSFLHAGGVFIAIGHDPATKIFGMPSFKHGHMDDEAPHLELDPNGYVIVEPNSSRTSVEGVFAGGDCVDHTYRQAVTAAGLGCMAAIDAERWLETQGE